MTCCLMYRNHTALTLDPILQHAYTSLHRTDEQVDGIVNCYLRADQGRDPSGH